jgi:predicted nucleic acid-binding protein
LNILRRFRLIRIDRRVANEYSRLRRAHPSLSRGDSLIAASSIARRLPLLTQNLRHFRVIEGLVLLPVGVRTR